MNSFSFDRVGAIVRRYLYLLRSSVPRALDLIYWPLVQMLTWGFLQTYLAKAPSAGPLAGRLGLAAGALIGAMLLWDILFRSQLGFCVSFLEEMWSRNLANLMMSPLRVSEFVVALMIMSLIRLAIGIVPVSLLAIWFFGFNLWGLGLALAAFFANLVLTGWGLGLFVSGLVLRYGLAAETLVWTIIFLMLPLACVYYPVSVLPEWLQHFSWVLPPTYVFEGLRALLIHRIFRPDLMIEAFALNLVIFAAAAISFELMLQNARRAGALLQTGE
ncbi:MAG TPA: ABC transporter permease [Methylovirgula sp.]|nr:ABC transporter permease [Methylovirgula sp.]